MATIRFLHADDLRLGAALSGLAAPPKWLEELAAGAVRQAVGNLLEAAAARHVDFLLIAGQLVDTAADLPAAVAWLKEHLQPLRRLGIQVAVLNDCGTDPPLLRDAVDIVVPRGRVLIAARTESGRVHLTVGDAVSSRRRGALTVSSENLPVCADGLTYVAASGPRRDAGVGFESPTDQSVVRRTAGPVQALSAAETGDCGALLVEADPAQFFTQTQFIETNAVQFATERLSLQHCVSADRLVSEVLRASTAIEGRSARTVLVDWVLQCDVLADRSEVRLLQEQRLLSAAREKLQGGHLGVWPRSIRFDSSSGLQLCGASSDCMAAYFDVAHGPVSLLQSSEGNIGAQGPRGMPDHLLSGLNLLSKAA